MKARKMRQCVALDNTTHRFDEINASILKFPTVFYLTHRSENSLFQRCFTPFVGINCQLSHDKNHILLTISTNTKGRETPLFTS